MKLAENVTLLMEKAVCISDSLPGVGRGIEVGLMPYEYAPDECIRQVGQPMGLSEFGAIILGLTILALLSPGITLRVASRSCSVEGLRTTEPWEEGAAA